MRGHTRRTEGSLGGGGSGDSKHAEGSAGGGAYDGGDGGGYGSGGFSWNGSSNAGSESRALENHESEELSEDIIDISTESMSKAGIKAVKW